MTVLTRADYLADEARTWTETQLQTAIRRDAKRLGYLTYHTHRSDRSEAGWPDLVLLHPRTGRLIITELKDQRRKPTKAQVIWLDALSRAQAPTAPLWRPTDYLAGTVAAALTEGMK